MEQVKPPLYNPSWPTGTRVRLTKPGTDYLQPGSIIAALPNPPQRQQNQWYDVRFDNGRCGRFLERYLERVQTETTTTETTTV
jgi:hypothetical protein